VSPVRFWVRPPLEEALSCSRLGLFCGWSSRLLCNSALSRSRIIDCLGYALHASAAHLVWVRPPLEEALSCSRLGLFCGWSSRLLCNPALPRSRIVDCLGYALHASAAHLVWVRPPLEEALSCSRLGLFRGWSSRLVGNSSALQKGRGHLRAERS
jgi:predicted small metal-binding protein